MVTRRKADFLGRAEFRSRACRWTWELGETKPGRWSGSWRVLCAEREWSPRWDTGVQGSPLLLCWGPGSHTFTYTQTFLFSEMASLLSISHGVKSGSVFSTFLWAFCTPWVTAFVPRVHHLTLESMSWSGHGSRRAGLTQPSERLPNPTHTHAWINSWF